MGEEEVIKYKLLTSQRNAVFACVQEEGFDPSAFDWGHDPSGISMDRCSVPTLVYIGTPYYFKFDRGERDFYLEFSPGRQTEIDTFQSFKWTNVIPGVRRWLGYIKKETELPDFWETLATERPLISSVSYSGDDNSPFTAEERIKLLQGLEEIKAYLKSGRELSLEQHKIIDAKFEYLQEASSRLGRKDWQGILISTLLSTALTIGLDGNSTVDWFRFAGSIVRQLLGQLFLPPTPYY